MKIINTRQDIAALPESERNEFLARLAASLHRYDESGQIITDETAVRHYGYTAADFQDAPIAAYIPPPTAPPTHPAIEALEDAEKNGIHLPLGESSVRLLCGDRDRALFSSALTLYRTHEDLLPDDTSKAAFRASQVTFADAAGATHTLTVEDARKMLVLYGATYQALWAAAAAAR